MERAVDEDRARVDDPALALNAFGAGRRDTTCDGGVESVDLWRSGELGLEDVALAGAARDDPQAHDGEGARGGIGRTQSVFGFPDTPRVKHD